MKIDIKVPTLTDLCFYCFGTGKLKAMQSVALFGGGSMRGKDAVVRCTHCKGTGRKK